MYRFEGFYRSKSPVAVKASSQSSVDLKVQMFEVQPIRSHSFLHASPIPPNNSCWYAYNGAI